MSFMLEVFYRSPSDASRESAITERVQTFAGQPSYREDAEPGRSICLTYEFPSWEAAQRAASDLQRQGEHVEGPVDYGTSEAAPIVQSTPSAHSLEGTR